MLGYRLPLISTDCEKLWSCLSLWVDPTAEIDLFYLTSLTLLCVPSASWDLRERYEAVGLR